MFIREQLDYRDLSQSWYDAMSDILVKLYYDEGIDFSPEEYSLFDIGA